MFTSEDFTTLASEADYLFASLPFESRFSFKWKKANAKPLGMTYQTAWENIPGFFVPMLSTVSSSTEIGDTVKQPVPIEIAVPKKFGETIRLNSVNYLNGITEHDVLETQDGDKYLVIGKQRRGYGAYYVLQTTLYKGVDDKWLESMYHRT
ncbi:MAG: hypothetical protein AABY07_10900 [Nanoarchaeota archaeon]